MAFPSQGCYQASTKQPETRNALRAGGSWGLEKLCHLPKEASPAHKFPHRFLSFSTPVFAGAPQPTPRGPLENPPAVPFPGRCSERWLEKSEESLGAWYQGTAFRFESEPGHRPSAAPARHLPAPAWPHPAPRTPLPAPTRSRTAPAIPGRPLHSLFRPGPVPVQRPALCPPQRPPRSCVDMSG